MASLLQTGGVTARSGMLFKEYNYRYTTRLKSMFQQSHGSDQTEFDVLLLHPMCRMSAKFSSILIESMIKGQCVTVQLQVRGESVTAEDIPCENHPCQCSG